MIGARKGGYRRSPGGGSMNKKKSIWGGGEFPYGGIFMWAVFSLHVRGSHAIFSVCGGSPFLHGGGGHYWACPPITIFAGASCHKNLSRSCMEVLIFFEGAIRSTKKTCPPPPPQHQFK